MTADPTHLLRNLRRPMGIYVYVFIYGDYNDTPVQLNSHRLYVIVLNRRSIGKNSLK